MDGVRDDLIARLLAGSASRRQTLKGVAGGLLAASLTGRSDAMGTPSPSGTSFPFRAQSRSVNDLVMANARFAAGEFPGAGFVPGRVYLIAEAIHEADINTEAQTRRLDELNWQGTYSTAAFVPSDRPTVFQTSWYARHDLLTNSSNAGK